MASEKANKNKKHLNHEIRYAKATLNLPQASPLSKLRSWGKYLPIQQYADNLEQYLEDSRYISTFKMDDLNHVFTNQVFHELLIFVSDQLWIFKLVIVVVVYWILTCYLGELLFYIFLYQKLKISMWLIERSIWISNIFFKLGFTSCKAEQPLRGMELQEKKHKKDYRIQKICLERTYS